MNIPPPGCTIVILEPPPGAFDSLALALGRQGHRVVQAEPWAMADRIPAAELESLGMRASRIGLILARLPGPAGPRLDFLRMLRDATPAPCIMAADPAMMGPAERIQLLEAGADDCLLDCMPPEEILARIQALLRRVPPSGRAGQSDDPDRDARPGQAPARMAGGWELSPQRRSLLSPDGNQVLRLTAAEFELLRLLSQAAGETVDRETICQAVFRRPWRLEDRAVDSLVKRVRQKVRMEVIATVRGQGYAIVLENLNA